MAKKTKIQPADSADEGAGQTPDGATDELPDYTAEQIAGMKPEEMEALLGNIKKFRASATQKSQEAAEIKRQLEQIQAESKYYKTQAEQRQTDLQKVYEQMSQLSQRPAQSTPSQPPEYDPYNPDKWAKDYQKWHQDQLKSTRDEFGKKFDELKSQAEEANLGYREMRIDKYLESAKPQFGKDVSKEEIELWARQHPDADWSDGGWKNTINQALRERQAIWDQKAEAKWQEYLAEKEKAAQEAQEVPGAPWAGGAPDLDKFADATPAEKEAMMKDWFGKIQKAETGGAK